MVFKSAISKVLSLSIPIYYVKSVLHFTCLSYQNVGSMLLKAVKYWGSIAPPEGPGEEGITMEAKETRSLVILSLEVSSCFTPELVPKWF